jgi:anti-sigma28 factor (negative regulator of flagellin synthesis)
LVKRVQIKRPELMDILSKLYRQERGGRKASAPEQTRGERGDRVEISTRTESLKKELSRLEESTDRKRSEKLGALARQLERGAYRVDEEELARIMLDEASWRR